MVHFDGHCVYDHRKGMGGLCFENPWSIAKLGILYGESLGRTEEAVAFLKQAANKYVEIRDGAGEGRARNNLAIRLRKLGRLDEARQEILRTLECHAQRVPCPVRQRSQAVEGLGHPCRY